jgi:hypothetical protein
MNVYAKTAALFATLALSAAPAFAAGQPTDTPNQNTNPGASHQPTTTPNQNSSDNPGTSHKLAAPGQYCKNESRKHVAGQKGTPFSQCVAAQAKLRSGATSSPREACKNESKKHVAGQHGTPFSICVSAGAKLLDDQKAQNS